MRDKVDEIQMKTKRRATREELEHIERIRERIADDDRIERMLMEDDEPAPQNIAELAVLGIAIVFGVVLWFA